MALLERILIAKQKEIELLDQKQTALTEKLPAKDHSLEFVKALKRGTEEPLRIIAECKRASPSLGLIREDYDPKEIASVYRSCGAAALSVLTENEFFQGDIEHVEQAGKCGLPILRKDFILSPLQLYQSKQAGAHAVLLIARLLSEETLRSLYELACKIGLGVLVEVHTQAEVEVSLDLPAKVIGINHRDLESLEMDLNLSARLAPQIRKASPDTILVAESGIENKSIQKKLQEHVDAVLIGTALMESKDIVKRWQEIFG